MGPTGLVKRIVGSTIKEFRGTSWNGISRARAKLIGESVTYESFEQFWGDAHNGVHSYATPGAKIRFYWNAGAATYTDVKIVGQDEFDPVQIVDGWIGRYRVTLDRLVVQ